MNIKTITLLCVLLIFIVEAVSAMSYDGGSHLRSRQKRASADFFGKIKSSITSSIGKASASSAGASSGTSSSKTFAVEKPVEKDIYFDGWELKKSILNTLFQAVKAITGGVTAIKGQLIKGSGYALSHGGKLIAASGDAVTNVGKKIALSAKLLPPEKPHYHKYFGSSSGHSSGHPTAEDFTSFAHDDLVEFAQPHELPVFAPEPHIPYLPVDLAYENHYPAPHYGPPPPLLDSPHSHLTNYISTERKEQEQHYDTFDTTSLDGTKTEDEVLSTHEANQKAVEALRLLLRKLPTKLIPNDNELQINDDDKNNNDLPDSEIPEFKPIKALTSTYKFQLGPFETETKHTIGGLDSNEHLTKTKFLIPGPVQTNSAPHLRFKQSNPIFYDLPKYQSNRHTINAHPLDLYHTMTLKNSPKTHSNNNNDNHNINLKNLNTNHHQHHHHHQQHHSNNAPLQTLIYLPPESNSSPNYEIQKSIQYELQ